MARLLSKCCEVSKSVDLNKLASTSGLTNPSIMKNGNHLLVTAKKIPYDRREVWLTENWDLAADANGKIIAEHFFAKLDQDLNVVDLEPLFFGPVKDDSTYYDSVDDIRLISWNSSIFIIGTCMRFDAVKCNSQWRFIREGMTRVFLAPFSQGEITKIKVLPSPSNARVEKNWITWEKHDGRLMLAVDINQGLAVALDQFDSSLACTHIGSEAQWGGGWSGSTNFVPVGQGYIGILHRASDSAPVVYNHMFAVCDQDFNVVRVSPPFSFSDQPVEFCIGMTRGLEDNKILISYGLWDEQAYIIELDIEEVIDFSSIEITSSRELYGIECDYLGYYADHVDLLMQAIRKRDGHMYGIRSELLTLWSESESKKQRAQGFSWKHWQSFWR